MDKKMNELPLWYKLTSAASIGFLAGCTVSGGVSPTIDSNPGSNNNPNNVDAIPTKTDFERAKETLNSFVTSHPEYANREASVVNFSINNIDSNTVILETTEEERQEISSFKYEFDGYPLQQYDKAIVFTMKTNPDGKSQWVRLAGVWFPTEDDSIITAWYYSPDAFDKNKEVIDFKQRVFGFNSRDDEYVFWPLVEPPYQMLWSLDISSKDSKDYTPWNGIDPFTLPVGAIPVGAGKALFAPIQVDIKPESLLPQEVKEKFELAGIDLKDMTNAKYDKDGLHITLESGEVVDLSKEDLEKNIYLGQDNVLQYRDETNQNVIYAFDKESGKWGVGISEAESAAIALFDKYGVAPDTYILTDVDGIMVGTDKETGVEIFRDGRFDISYAVKLAKKDCEPTDFKPDKWGFMQSKDKESLGIYLETLFDDSNYLISDDAWLWMYWGSIDRTRQCWGLFGSDAIVYRDETGLAQDIPIIHLTEDEVDEFTSNR